MSRRSCLGRRGLLRALALLVPLGLVVAACEPVPHPRFVVVDASDAVTVLGLSGDGSYTVVSATAASESVPGPGLWRVDRRDGAAVQLPEGATFQRISADGQRISLFLPGGGLDAGYRVWNNGTLVTPPLLTRLSKDLRFGLFEGFLDSRLRRWDLATNTRTLIGPDDAASTPQGISDDGTIAWYTMQEPGVGCRLHFLEIPTGEVHVHNFCGGMVSASGRHLLLASDAYSIPTFLPDINIGGPRHLQLIATRTPGVVVAETSTGSGLPNHYTEIHLADTRPVFWAAQVTWSGDLSQPCGTPFTPPCNFTEETLELVVGSPNGVVHIDDVDLVASAFENQSNRATINATGRFLSFTRHVHDRVFSRHEVLPEGRSAGDRPLISDDGKVIVPRSTGWSEFLAEDA